MDSICPPEALSVDGAGNVESEVRGEIMLLGFFGGSGGGRGGGGGKLFELYLVLRRLGFKVH